MGVSGSGKRTIIRALCNKYSLTLHVLEPAQIFLLGGRCTAVEATTRMLLNASLEPGGAAFLIPRCHDLVPKGSDTNDALIETLAAWLDPSASTNLSRLLVILTSSMEESMLHPLWNMVHLTLQMPLNLTPDNRRSLLQFFLGHSDLPPALLEDAVCYSGGFPPSALYSLSRQLHSRPEAVHDAQLLRLRLRQIRATLPDQQQQPPSSKGVTSLLQTHIEPVRWDEIYGQDQAKSQIQQAAKYLIDPCLRDRYRSRGLAPPRGILLHGPPGTGKTLLARATASALNAHFIPVTIPRILHAPIGESEKAIRSIFSQARHLQPSIIFFDEIDALVAVEFDTTNGRSSSTGSVTEKIATQIIEEFDAFDEDTLVLVMAATNLPDSVHPGLRRYRRLDTPIFVGPLSMAEQAQMIDDQADLFDREEIHSFKESLSDTPRTGAQLTQLIDQLKLKRLAASVIP